MRKSHKERSTLKFNYLFLVLNSIFIPIGCFTLIYSYELMPTGCFFLRYLIQTMFTYCIVQILGIPKYIEGYFKSKDSKEKNFSNSSARVIDLDTFNDYDQTPMNDNSRGHKNERSNRWYFEIGYQQSFSIAIFALTFVFA